MSIKRGSISFPQICPDPFYHNLGDVTSGIQDKGVAKAHLTQSEISMREVLPDVVIILNGTPVVCGSVIKYYLENQKWPNQFNSMAIRCKNSNGCFHTFLRCFLIVVLSLCRTFTISCPAMYMALAVQKNKTCEVVDDKQAPTNLRNRKQTKRKKKEPAQSPLRSSTVDWITVWSRDWILPKTSLIRQAFSPSGSRESRNTGR